MLTEFIADAFTVDHAVAEGKNAIIVGQRAIWAIDAGPYTCDGQKMVGFIHSLGRKANRLIYTHGHGVNGDHVLRNAAFRGAETVAHNLMPVERRPLPVLTKRADKSVKKLAAQSTWPQLPSATNRLFI